MKSPSSVNTEEKSDTNSMTKPSQTASEQIVPAPEAGQTDPNNLHAPVQSDSLSESDQAGGAFTTEMAQKYMEQLKSDPPVGQLESIRKAVEDIIRGLEQQNGTDQQQKLEELRRVVKDVGQVQQRLQGAPAQAEHTVH